MSDCFQKKKIFLCYDNFCFKIFNYFSNSKAVEPQLGQMEKYFKLNLKVP